MQTRLSSFRGILLLACALACAGPAQRLSGRFESGRYTSVRHWFSIAAPLADPDVSCSDESTQTQDQEWASDGLRYGIPSRYTHKVGVVALPEDAARAMDLDPMGQTVGALARREADYWKVPANADVIYDDWYESPVGSALARVYHARATSNTRETWLGVSIARISHGYYAYAVVRNDADPTQLQDEVRALFGKLEPGPEVGHPTAPR
ncbi:MAG TPA: hypothetical protein VMR50_21570 [Myxococcota bacterium]|nr:hypothetical protein [Myxococcota bacterium]